VAFQLVYLDVLDYPKGYFFSPIPSAFFFLNHFASKFKRRKNMSYWRTTRSYLTLDRIFFSLFVLFFFRSNLLLLSSTPFLPALQIDSSNP
jgi:hypothetical protein